MRNICVTVQISCIPKGFAVFHVCNKYPVTNARQLSAPNHRKQHNVARVTTTRRHSERTPNVWSPSETEIDTASGRVMDLW